MAAKRLFYSYWLIVCHLSYESGIYSISSLYLEMYILWSTQFLKMIESGFTIAKSHSFNHILIDISSGPQALQISMLIMSLSSNWTEESLSSVKKV